MAGGPPEPSRPHLAIERRLVDQAGDIIEDVSSPHDKCARFPDTQIEEDRLQTSASALHLIQDNLQESAATGNNAIVKVCTYHPAAKTGNHAVARLAFRLLVEKVVRTMLSNIWTGLFCFY